MFLLLRLYFETLETINLTHLCETLVWESHIVWHLYLRYGDEEATNHYFSNQSLETDMEGKFLFSPLCNSLDLRPRINNLPSLSLSFHIYKMGISEITYAYSKYIVCGKALKIRSFVMMNTRHPFYDPEWVFALDEDFLDSLETRDLL